MTIPSTGTGCVAGASFPVSPAVASMTPPAWAAAVGRSNAHSPGSPTIAVRLFATNATDTSSRHFSTLLPRSSAMRNSLCETSSSALIGLFLCVCCIRSTEFGGLRVAFPSLCAPSGVPEKIGQAYVALGVPWVVVDQSAIVGLGCGEIAGIPRCSATCLE